MAISSQKFHEIVCCRICGSDKLEDFFVMGELPLPNAFLSKTDLKVTEDIFPLTVCFCQDCALVQLRFIVKADYMFRNYFYIPSGARTRMKDFADIAKQSKERFGLSSSSLVLDIGSNDGSLLSCFKGVGVKVLGIDPAENIKELAEKNGIPTIVDYFTPAVAEKMSHMYGKASVATATNVFAHVEDLHGLMASLSLMLDEDGVFISQFPYLVDLLGKKQFDTIYHEHMSYYSLKPLMRLAEISGFEIFDAQRNELDGGAVRVFWKKKGNTKWKVETERLQSLLGLEERMGLYSLDVYKTFGEQVEQLKHDLRTLLYSLKEQKKRIVGYGAPAKGTILLNYFGITSHFLDYVVDSTGYKQGRFVPGVRLEIFSEKKVYEDKPDYLLILAWNFAREIMEKNSEFHSFGKFIIPNPTVEIV